MFVGYQFEFTPEMKEKLKLGVKTTDDKWLEKVESNPILAQKHVHSRTKEEQKEMKNWYTDHLQKSILSYCRGVYIHPQNQSVVARIDIQRQQQWVILSNTTNSTYMDMRKRLSRGEFGEFHSVDTFPVTTKAYIRYQ